MGPGEWLNHHCEIAGHWALRPATNRTGCHRPLLILVSVAAESGLADRAKEVAQSGAISDCDKNVSNQASPSWP